MVSSPLPLDHGWTMPHFGVMTSSRLGKSRDSSSGTRDRCHCHRWTEPDQRSALAALRDAMSNAAHGMSMKGPRMSAILPLL